MKNAIIVIALIVALASGFVNGLQAIKISRLEKGQAKLVEMAAAIRVVYSQEVDISDNTADMVDQNTEDIAAIKKSLGIEPEEE